MAAMAAWHDNSAWHVDNAFGKENAAWHDSSAWHVDNSFGKEAAAWYDYSAWHVDNWFAGDVRFAHHNVDPFSTPQCEQCPLAASYSNESCWFPETPWGYPYQHQDMRPAVENHPLHSTTPANLVGILALGATGPQWMAAMDGRRAAGQQRKLRPGLRIVHFLGAGNLLNIVAPASRRARKRALGA